MKLNKSILMAGAVALAMVSVANADVTVRITGSTAARKFVNDAILNTLGSCTWAIQNSATSNNDQWDNVMGIYKGTFNGTNYIVKTSFTGSEAGIQTVDQKLPVAFLPDTTVTGNAKLASPATPVNETPDIAMSDTFQSTSQFAKSAIVSGTTYTALTESTYGSLAVVPFVYVASINARALITGSATGTPNVTTAQLRTLYANGVLGVASWTGNSADETKYIFALGRNPDSGTRLTCFAEAGLGAIATVYQYAPVTTNTTGTNGLITGATNTVLRLNGWPIETINGVSTKTLGNSGYNSGPDLGYALGSNDTSVKLNSGTAKAVYGMIGYVSTGDAGNASPNGTNCTYNGVAYSTGTVFEGSYPLWTYEHMYYRSTADSDNAGTTVLASSLAYYVQNTSTQNKLKIASMRVSRTVEGGALTTSY